MARHALVLALMHSPTLLSAADGLNPPPPPADRCDWVQVDDGNRWLRLEHPIAVLTAHAAADVGWVLREVERQAAVGRIAVGLVSYEAGTAFSLEAHGARLGEPLVHFTLYDARHVSSHRQPPHGGRYEVGPTHPTVDRAEFEGRLRRIREHLARGDSYQVNQTFQLDAAFEGDPCGLFADLVHAQRCRYGARVHMGTTTVCSASPELFFRKDGDRLVSAPMKGTISRGRTMAEDAVHAETLLASRKDRAENVMVADMVRNDLGKIAVIGSVRARSLCEIEQYPTLWQMTSTIEARSRAPLDEVFAALFPSASITGAPKVRTMEIIRDIEQGPRGVYTGAIGTVGPGNAAQFNVAIRTAVVDRARGALGFGVGSGVVWDSEPAAEYDECVLKARVLGARGLRFDLVETLRWTPGHGFFLHGRHLERLAESARYFGFTFEVAAVEAALARTVDRAMSPQRVRLLMSEDGRARCEATPLDPESLARPAHVRVALARRPVDERDAFLFHKTTRRLQYAGTIGELSGGPEGAAAEDVVFVNQAGLVTESLIGNLVVEIQGRRVTPPVSCGLLPGTLRAELLATGQIEERAVTVGEWTAAAHRWVINSVRGWRPVAL